MTSDRRNLTLEHLRAFLAVAENGSFTVAAKAQMRTQSALTHQIKAIETILGERLFLRTRGHVEGVTEAGKRLLPYARKVLTTLDDALVSLDRPALGGSIRVGVMDDFDVAWLIELIARFKAIHPECAVSAVSDFSTNLETRLARREIDVAIIKRLADVTRSPDEKLLRRERLVWAAEPGFSWSQGEPLPLIVFHEGCVYRGHILAHLERMGISVQLAYEGQSYTNVRGAVQAGLGISALAESQIEDAGLHVVTAIDGIGLPDLGMVEVALRKFEGNDSAVLAAFMREIERYAG